MSGKRGSKRGKKSIEDTYQKMSPIEHVLKRPDMYIGEIKSAKYNCWVFNDKEQKMEFREMKMVPGLYKIFDEVLVNTIDHWTRLNDENATDKVTMIKVWIDQKKGEIAVYNNGKGVDVAMHKEHNVYVPEMIFGQLLTSANYDTQKKKTTGGKNGIGGKACCIFSESFTVETVDAERGKKYIQTFSKNMSEKTKPKITSTKIKPYTKITFKPDLAKFGLKKLDDNMVALMRKRVYDCSACTDRTVGVYLDGKKIATKSFEDYVNLYIGKKSETKRVYEKVSDRWEVVACVSPDDKMEQISFVNGIYTGKGGKHVDHVASKVTNMMVKYINEKKRGGKKLGIQGRHIKDNLWVFVKSVIEDPSFDGQTKDELTTPSKDFGSKCSISEKFIEKLAKTGIIEKASALSNYKSKVAGSKNDGAKVRTIRGIPKLDDANWAGGPKSGECTLILTEGDSAKALAVAGLSVVGRDKFGVFPLKGKLLNVREATMAKLSNNTEIQALIRILGLQRYQKGTSKKKIYKDTKELRYDTVMIFTDQDFDGFHIKALLVNFFNFYWPSLLENKPGFICTLNTPIIKVTKKTKGGKKKRGKKNNEESVPFYSMGDFETWRKANSLKLWNVKYYKGLGTSTSLDAKVYFKNYEKDKMIYYYSGKDCEDAIILGFCKKMADNRKKWLADYDINDVLNMKEKRVTFRNMIYKELKHFSNASNIRSIPSICDGMKPSQRKIMYGSFKKFGKKNTEMKVGQLGGYVSSVTDYHHGEKSLYSTIIGMAQDYVGSNNVNLLHPEGQFGTRLQGGKDHSSERYIYTSLEDITHYMFNKKDEPVLNFLLDDTNKPIEPKWYLPIMPIVLINGCHGVGTGYSTHVPQYNPLDILKNIRRLMNGKEVKEMTPWVRGFEGKVIKKGESFATRGKYKIDKSRGTITISELPVGTWTEDYRAGLIKMRDGNEGDDKKKKTKAIIESINNQSTDTKAKFIVKYNKNLKTVTKMLDDEAKFIKTFKLEESKSMGTTNMYLFNKDGNLQKYKSTEEILEEYYGVRLEYYGLRKKYWLEQLKKELNILESRKRFVEAIVNKKLTISNRDEEEIVPDLEKLGIHPFYIGNNNSVTGGYGKEHSVVEVKEKVPTYDYLFSMQMRSLTKKKLEELRREYERKKDEHDTLLNKTAKQLWVEDLDEFEDVYREVYELPKKKSWTLKEEEDTEPVSDGSKPAPKKKRISIKLKPKKNKVARKSINMKVKAKN